MIQQESIEKVIKITSRTLLLLFCLYLLIILFNITKHPITETCMESNVIAIDKISGYSLKHIQCMKGYTEDMFPDGGFGYNTYKTNGYFVYKNNENDFSNVMLRSYDGGGPLSRDVSYYSLDKNIFLLTRYDYIKGIWGPVRDIYHFNNGELTKIDKESTEYNKMYSELSADSIASYSIIRGKKASNFGLKYDPTKDMTFSDFLSHIKINRTTIFSNLY